MNHVPSAEDRIVRNSLLFWGIVFFIGVMFFIWAGWKLSAPTSYTAKIWMPKNSKYYEVSASDQQDFNSTYLATRYYGTGRTVNNTMSRYQYEGSFGGNENLIFHNGHGDFIYMTKQGEYVYTLHQMIGQYGLYEGQHENLKFTSMAIPNKDGIFDGEFNVYDPRTAFGLVCPALAGSVLWFAACCGLCVLTIKIFENRLARQSSGLARA